MNILCASSLESLLLKHREYIYTTVLVKEFNSCIFISEGSCVPLKLSHTQFYEATYHISVLTFSNSTQSDKV